jgi:hypothetical protein
LTQIKLTEAIGGVDAALVLLNYQAFDFEIVQASGDGCPRAGE